ncbi:hypothetical protein HPP92_010567 [Vanilla planifolia]|nr:hypothetical protein HPP92_010567 [Vanilla planifolia]
MIGHGHQIWFKQSHKMFNNSLPSTLFPIESSSNSDSMELKPLTSLLEDISPSEFCWEAGNSSNSSASSGNSDPLFDSNTYPWSQLVAERGEQVQFQGETEELKWLEYLNGSIPVSTAVQGQNQEAHADVKSENRFGIDGLGVWLQNQ